MYTEWTKNIKDSKQKTDFENEVKGSSTLIDRLLEILEEREGEQYRAEMSLSTYDTPQWDVKQAHLNGSRSERWFLRQLLESVYD